MGITGNSSAFQHTWEEIAKGYHNNGHLHHHTGDNANRDEQQENSFAPEEGMIVRIDGLSGRYLHLNLDQYKGKEVGFKVSDITGDTVKKFAGYSETCSFSLDVGELPSGVYLLNVESEGVVCESGRPQLLDPIPFPAG